MYLKLSVPKRQISRIPKVKRAFYHDTSFDSLEEADPSESVDFHLPGIQLPIALKASYAVELRDVSSGIRLILHTCLQVVAEPVTPRCQLLDTVKVTT